MLNVGTHVGSAGVGGPVSASRKRGVPLCRKHTRSIKLTWRGNPCWNFTAFFRRDRCFGRGRYGWHPHSSLLPQSWSVDRSDGERCVMIVLFQVRRLPCRHRSIHIFGLVTHAWSEPPCRGDGEWLDARLTNNKVCYFQSLLLLLLLLMPLFILSRRPFLV